MKFELLELLNFRNYHKLSLKFSPNVNIIYGKNGSGKTNIVEAIYVLALTKTFRNVNDKSLIRKSCEKAKIKGTVKQTKKIKYQVEITKEGKKVQINNNKIQLLSEYIAKIPIVVFSPGDLRILKDTPITRRKFLNIELSFYDSNYLKYVSDYNKVLKQRNSYLKQLSLNANKSYEYLDILTQKLIELGKIIYDLRLEFINQINLRINDYYNLITKEGSISVKYLSTFDKSSEELAKKFKKIYEKELNFGKTLLGVHLDDLDFLLDDNKAKEWASEGQIKNIIVALKLAELEMIKERLGFGPILILDDLFSELDKEKINNILKLLPSDCQIFITTTELSKLKKSLKENSKKFKVFSGNVVEE
ncbi:MAG: DNA replication/repair protein RecF [Bacilli bacterium]|nr:DNA replication/repair protein RecF [Bacilli bacterium]